jgi:hypothetical protein
MARPANYANSVANLCTGKPSGVRRVAFFCCAEKHPAQDQGEEMQCEIRAFLFFSGWKLRVFARDASPPKSLISLLLCACDRQR